MPITPKTGSLFHAKRALTIGCGVARQIDELQHRVEAITPARIRAKGQEYVVVYRAGPTGGDSLFFSVV